MIQRECLRIWSQWIRIIAQDLGLIFEFVIYLRFLETLGTTYFNQVKILFLTMKGRIRIRMKIMQIRNTGTET
jgi:hypothetical protein